MKREVLVVGMRGPSRRLAGVLVPVLASRRLAGVLVPVLAEALRSSILIPTR